MCEWLACAEWCDVQLVCSGHTFNAHRAVLASVSVFLRDILLSSHQDDTPTFIVLPDFDLEAMTSVLYYIYHGEVFIKNHKLFCFLDIIRTLRVNIDNDYLPKIRETIGDIYLDIPTHCLKKQSQNIFTLNSETDNHHGYIKIRKEDRCQDILPQKNSQNNTDDDNKRVNCRNQTDSPPSLANSQATFECRQRNSFLRHLYMEKYPRNGNVNGLDGGGVLAIPNELYQASTSVLLTNANGKLPSSVDDILPEASIKMSDYAFFIPKISPQRQCTQNISQIHDKAYNASNKLFCSGNLNLISGTPLINCKIPHSYANLFSEDKKTGLSERDFQMSSSFRGHLSSGTQKPPKYFQTINVLKDNLSIFTGEDGKSVHSSNVVRTQIFNQVIESPWRPRLPNNFKPFKRKGVTSCDLKLHCKEDDFDSRTSLGNDRNNNVKEINVKYNTHSSENDVRGEFKCSICSKVFATENGLSTHKKGHSSSPRYSCVECGKTFSQLRNFKYHMSVHRGTREFAATCAVCGKYFNDRGYLSSHMKIHRNRKEYKCAQCPKSFNQRVAYNMHIRIHTGLKPHVCDECGKGFSRKMLLKQHQRTHSGERPYACPHCDKRFADRSNMTLHLRLHTGVKPFSCSLCPKSFTKKHHLKSHLNFHTGLKPYACPRCNLGFTQSSNMKTHIKKCHASVNDITTITSSEV